MAELLAFHVSDSDEQYNHYGDEAGRAIIFAASEEAAWEAEPSELRDQVAGVWRAPEFDQYAPGPVTNLQMIEHGWHFECSNCGEHVSRDGERYNDEADEYVAMEPVAHGDAVYCCQACMAIDFASTRQRRAREAAAINVVLSRYPETIKVTHAYHPGDAPGLAGAQATILLPGLRYDVNLDLGFGTAWVARCDADTFNALYSAKPQQPAGRLLDGVENNGFPGVA